MVTMEFYFFMIELERMNPEYEYRNLADLT